MIDGAVARLEADYAASGRTDIFAALVPFLGAGTAEPPDQAEIARALGMSHAA